MRARLCVAWLVGILLVVGCETNQPIQQDQQTIELSFAAFGASVQAIATWTMWEDTNGDGDPDDVDADGEPDVFLWCIPQPSFVTSSQMPWSYSVQVEKVPADQTDSVILARTTEPNSSFAEYDPGDGSPNLIELEPLQVTNRTGYCLSNREILCNPDNPLTTICPDMGGTCVASGVCSGDASVECAPDDPADVTCPSMGLGQCNNVPVTREFFFQGDRLSRSGANRTTLSAPPNILAVTDPVAATQTTPIPSPTGGICPGIDLGDPNVGGNSTPWSFPLNKGETVTVEARRLNVLPEGFVLWNTGGPPPASATVVYVQLPADPIVARFTVDGGSVGITGSTATTAGDPESFIDFFFTSK